MVYQHKIKERHTVTDKASPRYNISHITSYLRAITPWRLITVKGDEPFIIHQLTKQIKLGDISFPPNFLLPKVQKTKVRG